MKKDYPIPYIWFTAPVGICVWSIARNDGNQSDENLNINTELKTEFI